MKTFNLELTEREVLVIKAGLKNSLDLLNITDKNHRETWHKSNVNEVEALLQVIEDNLKL